MPATADGKRQPRFPGERDRGGDVCGVRALRISAGRVRTRVLNSTRAAS